MPAEVTFGYEFRDRALQTGRRSEAGNSARKAKRLREMPGSDNVTRTQPRSQRLAEGSNVNNAFAVVETLQGGKRARIEFAIVVIFDDVCVGLLRPLQQFGAPSEGHRAAQWELMRRCHVGKRRPSWQLACPHTVTIDWDSVQNQTVGRKDRSSELVAWIFDRDVLAALRHDEGDQMQCGLCSFDHDDLIGIRHYPTKLRDMACNRFTQGE